MIPDDLVNSILKRQAVLFLGAGASKESGGPIGSELAEYIANQANIDEDTSDLAVFTQIAIKDGIVTRKQIELCIKDRLKDLQPSEGYRAMAHLPWKDIFTVNFDDLVEKSYSSVNCLFQHKVVTADNLLDDRINNEIRLFKLHGSIADVYSEENHLTLTYDDLISENSFKNSMLRMLTRSFNDTIIFVGYSFSDKLIEDILKTIKLGPNFESIKRMYVVTPISTKAEVAKYKAIYNVDTISMTSDSFFIEIYKKYERSYKAKLQALGSSLSLYIGSDVYEFSPSIKNALNTHFEYYDPNKKYPSDAKYFYSCGIPVFGNIMNNLDINRNIIYEDNTGIKDINSREIPDIIVDKLLDKNTEFYKITGPAAVGKSTLCMRISIELFKKGVLTLITKETESIPEKLLCNIYNCIKKPFVIIVDDVVNYSYKLGQMIKQAEVFSLPISFLLAARENDWECMLDKQLKNKVNKTLISFKIVDELNSQQSIEIVDKLLLNKAFKEKFELNRDDMIKVFRDTNNIVAALMRNIENTDFETKIASDYDNLSEQTQNAYGMISLVNRLCLPFKWELLQRSLNNEFGMDWNDFITYVIRAEGKGNILERGSDGDYYYTCRHNYIAELITKIHYKGKVNDEIKHYITIIKSVNTMTSEEIFINSMLQYIISHAEDLSYTNNQILELLDAGLDILSDPYVLLHIKGIFLMEKMRDYNSAIACFEKCIRDKKNDEYALHSLGMAHFYLAKEHKVGKGIRTVEIMKAKKVFINGIKEYNRNFVFIRSYLQLLDYESSFSINGSLAEGLEDIIRVCDTSNLDDNEIIVIFSRLRDKAVSSGYTLGPGIPTFPSQTSRS